MFPLQESASHRNPPLLSHYRMMSSVSTRRSKRATPTHRHTHPCNGLFSGTTRVSRYQKGKTNLDFSEARDSEWQWHQLCRMQVCPPRSRQITTPAPHHSVFTGRMPFLPPNQQSQSTERKEPHQSIPLLFIRRQLCRPPEEELCFRLVRPSVRACVFS